MVENRSGISGFVEQMHIGKLKTIAAKFTQELKDAQAGKTTSLPFIIHELSPSSIVADGEVFQSLVIGGTVGNVATLKKTRDNIEILEKKEKTELAFKSKEDFLAFVSSNLPDNIDVLALNFAYPIEPVLENGKLDGILIAVTKEGGFHDLVGKKIGKEVEDYVLATRNKKIRVAVANDTVCLLAAGLSQFEEKELAAGIVGTGFNIAFFLDKNILVNLESANFDKFPHTKEGQIVDKESAQPGKSHFEKETAGAYLYRHFNSILKEHNIDYHISSTEELDKISHKNIPRISEIARNLLIRSAQLVACQIAGVVSFMDRSMVFNMEGSLFWKGNNYKETVEQTIKKLVLDHSVRFVEIENSAFLGAAKLVA